MCPLFNEFYGSLKSEIFTTSIGTDESRHLQASHVFPVKSLSHRLLNIGLSPTFSLITVS